MKHRERRKRRQDWGKDAKKKTCERRRQGQFRAQSQDKCACMYALKQGAAGSFSFLASFAILSLRALTKAIEGEEKNLRAKKTRTISRPIPVFLFFSSSSLKRNGKKE